MSGGLALTPTNVLAATAGLIAFHIGLLTLAGRERKAPYVVNLIFWIFLLSLLIAAVAVAAALVPSDWQGRLLQISGWLFVGALVLSARQVYRITARLVYFVDTVSPKQWPGVRQIRRALAGRQGKSQYQHIPDAIPKELVEGIHEIVRSVPGCTSVGNDAHLRSLAITADRHTDANALLVSLAMAFLNRRYAVQYTSASRHPLHFLDHLHSEFAKAEIPWLEKASLIVAVDAYSSHFAFLDSIYAKKDKEVTQDLNVRLVRSKMTYAGIHTAASEAFQIIRKRTKGDQQRYRAPALVIYDGMYALTDLESPEQYRIFVRHVLPSEAMWGAMFTVFVECAQPDADWKVLGSYAGMELDLRRTRNVEAATPTVSEPPPDATRVMSDVPEPQEP